jgi:ABC-type multidrug transport system permease subunit
MKVNVIGIVRDHLSTLRDARSNRMDYGDVLIFYGVPIASAAAAYFLKFSLKTDAYNVSITFFGIFLALLLNIQVAIFSIFQRKWVEPVDKRLAEKQKAVLEERRSLLGELNSNISYLTVVSSVALVSIFVFFVAGWTSGAGPAVVLALYSHFMLTFIMIIKRAHALFQKEYRDSPQ